MLVLTRKPGEKIFIGDDIVVTMVAIRRDDQFGDRIRIGLEAPSHVPICREEVFQQRRAGQDASARSRAANSQDETRELSQKIDALGLQAASSDRGADPNAPHNKDLLMELRLLRAKCDALLHQLSRHH